ncbi:MAG: hypothetical protein Q9212_005731 [Teloschistes hypoglaucus]
MFCSYGGSPRILRFFCWGTVIEWSQKAEFERWIRMMGKEKVEGGRAVIALKVWKVQTSCGYGVPFLSLSPASNESTGLEAKLQDRETMGHWASKQIEKNTLREYQKKNNAYSLDGLPGLKVAVTDSGESIWWVEIKTWARRIFGGEREALGVGMIIGVIVVMLSQMVIGITK